MLEVSTKEIMELKLIFKFLGKGKPDKVRRSIVTNEFENGGLNIRNVENHINILNINWVKRPLSKDQANWSNISTLNLISPKFKLDGAEEPTNINFYLYHSASWI